MRAPLLAVRLSISGRRREELCLTIGPRLELQGTVMELGHRTVRDADDARILQTISQQLEQLGLSSFVQSRGRLIQKEPAGPLQQGPRQRYALLLST